MHTEKTPKYDSLTGSSLLTSHDVGKILQVNPSSVNKWVKDGRISAFRTPGGHHRIRAQDLVLFLNEHKMPVPRLLSDAGRRRLMVVDDDPLQLHAMERLLSPVSRFVDVLLLENGLDALIQIGSFKPHMLMLDYMMPNLDGLETCRRIKAIGETVAIKIIIASGQLTDAVETEAIAAGAHRCLHKPISISTILEELGLAEELIAQAAS